MPARKRSTSFLRRGGYVHVRGTRFLGGARGQTNGRRSWGEIVGPVVRPLRRPGNKGVAPFGVSQAAVARKRGR